MLRLLVIRFFSDWRNPIPLVIIIAFFAVAALAPIISPPLESNEPAYNRVAGFSEPPIPPNSEILLGTFPGGYDVVHTLVWGTRSALQFGLIVALATAALGIAVGAGSNFIGGAFGRLGMRVTDGFLAFPPLAAIMLFSQLFRPFAAGSIIWTPTPFQQLMADWNIEPVMLGLILFSWMAYSRLTYVSIEQQKAQEYVMAARVMGLSNWRIFFRHILPNIVSPMIVLITKDVGGMVVLEAAFVFIGVSNFTAWGKMIAVSKNWIIGPTLGFTYWWTFIPATLLVILFSVSWQLLGQRLNAALNPRNFSFLK